MEAPSNTESKFTITISHFVKNGQEQNFETALYKIIKQAQGFKGYSGIQIFSPKANDENEYLLVVRFDNEENYRHWHSSKIRKNWSQELKQYIHKESEVRHTEGLEFWFQQKNNQVSKAPSKLKMAILTWLVIFPLIISLSNLAGSYLSFLSPIIRMVLVSVTLVFSMTYFIMPRVTKLFSFWLFQ